MNSTCLSVCLSISQLGTVALVHAWAVMFRGRRVKYPALYTEHGGVGVVSGGVGVSAFHACLYSECGCHGCLPGDALLSVGLYVARHEGERWARCMGPRHLLYYLQVCDELMMEVFACRMSVRTRAMTYMHAWRCAGCWWLTYHHDKIKMERIEQKCDMQYTVRAKSKKSRQSSRVAWQGLVYGVWCMVDGWTGQTHPVMHPRFSQRLGWVGFGRYDDELVGAYAHVIPKQISPFSPPRELSGVVCVGAP